MLRSSDVTTLRGSVRSPEHSQFYGGCSGLLFRSSPLPAQLVISHIYRQGSLLLNALAIIPETTEKHIS